MRPKSEEVRPALAPRAAAGRRIAELDEAVPASERNQAPDVRENGWEHGFNQKRSTLLQYLLINKT